MIAPAARRQHRTLFLSDLHLGTKGCQAARLVDFLDGHDAETIYLVGDIIDEWRLRLRWHWPDNHSAVLHRLHEKAASGARVVYLPGNHDEFVRPYCGSRINGFHVAEDAIHEAADGKRYLVVHGDCFDVIQAQAHWLALIGDRAYASALAINTAMNRIGRRLGLPYWSFSNWAKMRVKGVVNFIGRYEEALVRAARLHAVDGVICGHIHRAAIHEDFGLTYVNCGDWVESCTAIVEDYDGTLELVRWTPAPARPPPRRRRRRRER
ncbi:MAG: UDP-2,3-diacylglucosamine diphosphatase, partial [Bauldia sp.]